MRISLIKFLLEQNLPSTAKIDTATLSDNGMWIDDNNNDTAIFVEFHTNGNIKSFQYHLVEFDHYHRPHNLGPSYQSWYESGQTECITYEENNQFHRPHELGPAFQYWYEDGQLVKEEYWENGVRIKY